MELFPLNVLASNSIEISQRLKQTEVNRQINEYGRKTGRKHTRYDIVKPKNIIFELLVSIKLFFDCFFAVEVSI